MKLTNYDSRGAALSTFRRHRRTWSPVAAYHLTRYRFGSDPYDRLFSAIWLCRNRVPPSGDPQHMKPRSHFH